MSYVPAILSKSSTDPGVGRPGDAAQAGLHDLVGGHRHRHGRGPTGRVGRHDGLGGRAPALLRAEPEVLRLDAALQGERIRQRPIEIQLAGVIAVGDIVLAQADDRQVPTAGGGGIEAVVEHRHVRVAAIVVAVPVDAVAIHHHRRLHRVAVVGLGGADLAGDPEVIVENVFAVQADLLEGGLPLVVAILRADAHVVHQGIDQRAILDDAIHHPDLRLLAEHRGTAGLAQAVGLDVLLVALGVDLRIQRVQAEGGVGRWPELQRGGDAQALLVVLHQGVAREARRIGGRQQRGLVRRRGVEAAIGGAAGPAHGAGAFVDGLAFAVGQRDQRAEPAVVPGVGQQAREARAGGGRSVVEGSFQAAGGVEALVVEGTRGAQVDGRAERTFLDVRGCGLAGDQLREQVGGEHVEVEVAAAVRTALAVAAADRAHRFQAVDAHAGELRAEAAHGDVAALAGVAGDRPRRGCAAAIRRGWNPGTCRCPRRRSHRPRPSRCA